MDSREENKEMEAVKRTGGIIEPELGAKRLNMTFADFEMAMQKAGCKL